MQAELRWLHSPDTLALEDHAPEDPESFGLLLQVGIGATGHEGEDTFDFYVCSPKWFVAVGFEGEYLFGRHYLFLKRYDYELLWRLMQKLCNGAVGTDWNAIVQLLSKYGKWEFENDLDLHLGHPLA